MPLKFRNGSVMRITCCGDNAHWKMLVRAHYSFAMQKIAFLLASIFLLTQLPAQEDGYAGLLRRCAQHEASGMEDDLHFQFLERTQWSWGSETRVVIETSEGRADRIIEFNGQPLAPDQRQKQQHRLNKFLSDADARHDELTGQRNETKRRMEMARALPDAFVLEFSGKEASGQLRFKFSPNPKFKPNTREAQVYKGMQGTMWIDPDSERVARIEGSLFKDVNFGWGIFGSLHKGGHYELAQTQVVPGVWRITTLNLDFEGRILLVRQFNILRKESSSGFIPAPPALTYTQAVQKLLSEFE